MKKDVRTLAEKYFEKFGNLFSSGFWFILMNCMTSIRNEPKHELAQVRSPPHASVPTRCVASGYSLLRGVSKRAGRKVQKKIALMAASLVSTWAQREVQNKSR